MLKLYTYLVFVNRKLVSVVESTMDTYEDAVNAADYFIKNPDDAEKQIREWKKGK